jgi:hypothetical protein
MSDPLNNFLNNELLWQSLRSLRFMQPWPTPDQVDGCIVALEQMLAAERGEAGE